MKQLYKNIGFTGMSQLIYMVLAFVLIPFSYRYLGVEEFGLYTVATTVGFFIALLTDLGLTTIITREIAKHKSIAARFFGLSLVLKMVLSLFALVVLLIYLNWADYSPDAQQTILIFCLASLVGTFSQSAFAVFRGFEQMQYEAVAISLDKAISVTLGILFLLKGYDVKIFVISFVIAGLAKLLYSFTTLYRRLIHFQLVAKKRAGLVVLQSSFFFGFSVFLAMCYNYIDILMLQAMSSLKDIGYYSASYKLLAITSFFPTVLATAFLPRLTVHFKNLPQLAQLFSCGVEYLLLFILPMLPFVLLLASPLLQLIYGIDSSGSVPALRILVFAAAAQMLNTFFVPLYVSINKQRKIVQFQIVGLILNIVLNLMFIPRWSYWGAALATVATEGALLIFIVLYAIRTINRQLFPTWSTVALILISSLGMAATIYFTQKCNFDIIIVVLSAFVVYGLFLQFTGSLKWFQAINTLGRLVFKSRV